MQIKGIKAQPCPVTEMTVKDKVILQFVMLQVKGVISSSSCGERVTFLSLFLTDIL